MATNPACERFLPHLSPYIDGELAPAERTHLERHLAACPACTGRVADLRAESGLIRIGLEMAADEADFTGFSQAVMARITPDRPPLLERWRLSLSEFFTHHRGMMFTSLATAAALLAVLIPVVLMRGGAPVGYAGDQMQLQAVKVAEEARIRPVVLESKEGDGATIVWFEDRPAAPGSHAAPGGGSGHEQEEDVRLDGTNRGARKGQGLSQPAPKEGEL